MVGVFGDGTADQDVVCWGRCDPSVGMGGFDLDDLVFDIYTCHGLEEEGVGVCDWL